MSVHIHDLTKRVEELERQMAEMSERLDEAGHKRKPPPGVAVLPKAPLSSTNRPAR